MNLEEMNKFYEDRFKDIVPKEKVDPVVEAVRQDLLQRSTVGIKKYGVTLEDAKLSLRDWLQHLYEEQLDSCNYLKGAIMKLDKGEG